jgi:CTP:molybdopterin cytidylyltransferase MocA
MGGPNKLLAELGGKPLVRIVTEQALASKAERVMVVTGHQADQVEKALRGLKVTFVRNPDFAGGLATSVKSGISAVPDKADGAVICLGDMPLIDAHLIDRLIEAFAPDRGNLIVVPVSDNRRGNPVLWSRRFFSELMAIVHFSISIRRRRWKRRGRGDRVLYQRPSASPSMTSHQPGGLWYYSVVKLCFQRLVHQVETPLR